jgi:hypothetical protein
LSGSAPEKKNEEGDLRVRALYCFPYCFRAIRALQAIHPATRWGRQTDQEGAVASDETAAQDKPASAE